MRRRILSLAAVLCMAVTLTMGCGGNGIVGTEATETATEAYGEIPTETEGSAEETYAEIPTETEDSADETDVGIPTETEDSDSADENSGSANNLAAPSTNGKLHVDGTQLADESGNPVQLRGVSTHGIAWFPEYVNADCVAELHSWGANVFRIAMYTAEYDGYCTGGDQAYLKNLVKKGVKYATENDMYAIVDWHILSEGSPAVYQSDAEKFFSEMSAEFSGQNNVLYEICNEPNGGADWATIKAYAEDIIPIIRANDPDAVIIVGTPTWSQDVDAAAADPITGYGNIMYALHFYAATHKDDLRNKMTAAIDAGLPIFVTEFGICDASGSGSIDEDSANTWINLMNEYGVSYAMWNLSNKDESSAMINSGVSKTSGFAYDDLSQSGKWLYDTLQGALTSEISTSTSAAGSSSNQSSANEGNASNQSSASNGSTSSSGSSADGITVSKTLSGSWESDGTKFYMYDITVTNNSGSAISSWKVHLSFDGKVTVSEGWNCTYSAIGKSVTLRSVDYNGSLQDGESATGIGLIVSY
ncbi:MAG: cellulase family glycosylhydrolase [Clostridiales bacterium]|nr:cellulase family glycosylhydrolase [Clostridiales bacterium]